MFPLWNRQQKFYYQNIEQVKNEKFLDQSFQERKSFSRLF